MAMGKGGSVRLNSRAATFLHAITGRSTAENPGSHQGKEGGSSPGETTAVSPGSGAEAPDVDRAGDDSLSAPRIACIDIPALPLQLLAREHPEWRQRPMAVVAEDRPQGQILWVNEKAYRARVLPGLRYAAGLTLCRDLCAGEVATDEIDQGVEGLTELLRDFSPHIEPADSEPGVFWLDTTGLHGIERSLEAWVERICRVLGEQGFVAHVAVGFSRFASYAQARTTRGTVVFHDPTVEQRATARIRLDRLHIEPGLRTRLAKLGVITVGELLALPADGIGRRFGSEALRLHRQASGSLSTPLHPVPPDEPIDAWIELEYPEVNAHRLTFVVKRVLDTLLQQLADREHGLTRIELELLLDDHTTLTDSIQTAEPTLAASQVLELVRLRLEQLELTAGVVEITLVTTGSRIDTEQLELFAEKPRRDLAAANRALARLRTEFGRLSVVWAKLRHAHLPEASFTWEPCEESRFPTPRQVRERPLMRRIFDRPIPLPHRGHHEPDGWLVRGPEQGPVVKIFGPYTVSGGWWVREVHRSYRFVETQHGDIMWVYYDRPRRRWFLQGQVE